jgi:hypothetical protein
MTPASPRTAPATPKTPPEPSTCALTLEREGVAHLATGWPGRRPRLFPYWLRQDYGQLLPAAQPCLPQAQRSGCFELSSPQQLAFARCSSMPLAARRVAEWRRARSAAPLRCQQPQQLSGSQGASRRRWLGSRHRGLGARSSTGFQPGDPGSSPVPSAARKTAHHSAIPDQFAAPTPEESHQDALRSVVASRPRRDLRCRFLQAPACGSWAIGAGAFTGRFAHGLGARRSFRSAAGASARVQALAACSSLAMRLSALCAQCAARAASRRALALSDRCARPLPAELRQDHGQLLPAAQPCLPQPQLERLLRAQLATAPGLCALLVAAAGSSQVAEWRRARSAVPLRYQQPQQLSGSQGTRRRRWPGSRHRGPAARSTTGFPPGPSWQPSGALRGPQSRAPQCDS